MLHHAAFVGNTEAVLILLFRSQLLSGTSMLVKADSGGASPLILAAGSGKKRSVCM
jgi:hypothetical protein